jgi:hypothetical protein
VQFRHYCTGACRQCRGLAFTNASVNAVRDSPLLYQSLGARWMRSSAFTTKFPQARGLPAQTCDYQQRAVGRTVIWQAKNQTRVLVPPSIHEQQKRKHDFQELTDTRFHNIVCYKTATVSRKSGYVSLRLWSICFFAVSQWGVTLQVPLLLERASPPATCLCSRSNTWTREQCLPPSN